MKKLYLFVLCAVFLLAACLTGVLVSCQDGQTEREPPRSRRGALLLPIPSRRRSLLPLPERTPRPI